MVYSPVPEVALPPDMNPTPLSLEYRPARFPEEGVFFGRIKESLLGAVRVGLTSGDEGVVGLFPKRLGLGGGKLATRSPLRGGRGNDSAIDTARLGWPGFASDEPSNEGKPVNGLPNDPDIDRPVCDDGSCDVRRKAWSDGFGLSEFGIAGNADVGGFEAL